MDKLTEITQKRKIAHQRFVALGSKVYGRFMEMERATYSDGALPRKTKELIAVGISVQINCESCMQWHIEQARPEPTSTKSWKRWKLESKWGEVLPPSPLASP